jgi:hypothetical protein
VIKHSGELDGACPHGAHVSLERCLNHQVTDVVRVTDRTPLTLLARDMCRVSGSWKAGLQRTLLS